MYDFIFNKHKKVLTNDERELKIQILIDWQDASTGYIHYKRLTDQTIIDIFK